MTSKPSILWLADGGKNSPSASKDKKAASSVVQDRTWASMFHHKLPDLSTVCVKIGNKEYALASYGEKSAATSSAGTIPSRFTKRQLLNKNR